MKWSGDGRELLVLGAGGHAKVVLSTALASGWICVGLYDDDEAKHGTEVLGVPVRGGLPDLEHIAEYLVVIGFGGNDLRRKIAHRNPMARWATIIHPSAVVHETVSLGAGTVVFAGTTIQPDASFGRHCILNTGSTVDHDCVIGDFVHIAPGVHVAGGVHIGTGALMGIGTSVIPGITIGVGAIVGAGASVVRDLPPYTSSMGVPARPIKAVHCDRWDD